MTSRTQTLILALLLVLATFGVCYGLWFQYVNQMSPTGMIYCTPWYALCGISHLLGLLAIFMEYVEDAFSGNSHIFLQHHYTFAWLAIVVGYPLIVTYTWMMYFVPSVFVQFHVILAVIPVAAIVAESRHGYVRMTQACAGTACVSHGYMCFLAGDVAGMASAFIVGVDVLALSMPTRQHLWEFSSKEVFVIGLIAASYLMNLSITAMSKSPRSVKSLWPF